MAWAAVAGTFLGVMGSAESASANRKAQGSMQAAAQIRLVQQTMANAITRRDNIRSFRMTQAQTLAAGTSEGSVTSTAVQGALSSQSSQEASSLKYFDKQSRLDQVFSLNNRQAGIYAQQAANWNTFAQVAPAIGQLVGTVYNSLSTPSNSSTSTTPKSTKG